MHSNLVVNRANRIVSNSLANTAKSVGNKLGALGVGISLLDMRTNGVSTSNSLDLAFGLAGFIPGVGWAISGAYFLTNTAFEVTTGKNIGEYVDEYIEEW